MKVKNRLTGKIAQASTFNVSALCEILVYSDDGFCDTDYPSNWLFWIESENKWADFSHPKICPNNENTSFGECVDKDTITRGYSL
jgi:hypothetical protein